MSITSSDSSQLTSDTTESIVTQKNKRRLGYMKGPTQIFRTPAQKRASVMSLGHIDHLQHRFAIGARLAASEKMSSSLGSKRFMNSINESGHSHARSPPETVDLEESSDDFISPVDVPLPPSPIQQSYVRSVSQDLEPFKLKRALESKLEDALNLFSNRAQAEVDSESCEASTLELVERVSGCVRAARVYAASVPTHESISASFGIFQEDAIEVLAHLGNIRDRGASADLIASETGAIGDWITNLSKYLSEEERRTDSSMTHWLHASSWEGKEAARHYSFLKSYDKSTSALCDPDVDPLGYCQDMHTGTRLCQIYNAVVRRTRRPFGLITKYHENTDIRYRALENLRYWKAALSYRFEICLEDFDVHEIYFLSEVGRVQLECAISQFCRVAIEEMILTVQEADHGSEDDNLSVAVDAFRVAESGSLQAATT